MMKCYQMVKYLKITHTQQNTYLCALEYGTFKCRYIREIRKKKFNTPSITTIKNIIIPIPDGVSPYTNEDYKPKER